MSMSPFRTGCAVAALFLVSNGTGSAQAVLSEPTPLEVEIVFSKYMGDELTGRVPYSLVVNASQPARTTQLRLGIEVPVIVDASGTQQYRNVGTNIDCRAFPLDGGAFQLDIAVEQSSLYLQEANEASVPTAEGVNPVFRTFSSEYVAVLKDGGSIQLSSATDPVSGEVSKVHVSVRVLEE